jgi:hypothetical protein
MDTVNRAIAVTATIVRTDASSLPMLMPTLLGKAWLAPNARLGNRMESTIVDARLLPRAAAINPRRRRRRYTLKSRISATRNVTAEATANVGVCKDGRDVRQYPKMFVHIRTAVEPGLLQEAVPTNVIAEWVETLGSAGSRP